MACEAAVQADPEWQAAMRKRGVEDFSLAMIDPWAAGYTGPEEDPARAPDPAPADVGALRAGRARLRAAGRGPRRRGRPRRDGGRRRRTTTASSRSRRRRGNYDPERMADPDNVPRFAAPRDGPQADRDHPARGPELHGRRATRVRWQKWQLRIGFTPREGLVLHEHRLRGPRTLRPIIYRASLAEMYVPYGDPAPTHRFKNVFDMGEYGVGWLANPLDARLRLPRRDPLLRRRRQRPGRRADDDPERHLHARGGRRDRLEAHRLPHRGGRGAAAAAARASRRSPPSATTSTGTSGTSTPTARSSTRSSSRRDLDRRAGARRAARRTARWSRPASTGRTTSTSSACGWTWRSTATRTRSCRSTPSRCPSGPENPTGHGVGDQAHGATRPRREAAGADRPAARPLLADREPGARSPRSAIRSPTSSSRARTWRRCSRRTSRFAQRAGFTQRARVGDGLRPGASASPPATTRTSTRAATACRATPRPTARPRTPTWCSGTRSAPTTSSRPEDWPVMPVTHIGFKLKPRRLLRRQPGARHAALTPEALRAHRE